MLSSTVLPLLLLLSCCVAQARVDNELEGTLQRVARAAVTSDNVRRLILDTMTKLYEDGASTTQLGEAMLKFIYLLKGAELGYMKETKPTEPEGPEVEGITAPQNGTNSNATETEDLTNSTTPDASLMPTPMPDESMISATSTVIVMATSVNSMAGLAISPSTSLVEMPSSENLMENSNSSSGNTTDPSVEKATQSTNVTEAPSTGPTEQPNQNNATEPTESLSLPAVETTTASASSAGENGEWGEWSSCSASCGACGLRKRSRDCSVTGCSHSEQTQKCGLNPCPSRVVASKHYCYKPVECPQSKYPGSYPVKNTYPGHSYPHPTLYPDKAYPGNADSYDYQVMRKRRSAYDLKQYPGQRSSPHQTGTYNINIQAGSAYDAKAVRGPAVGHKDPIYKDSSGKCLAYMMCETTYESGPYCCPGHKIRGEWCMTDQYYQWYSRYYGHYNH